MPKQYTAGTTLLYSPTTTRDRDRHRPDPRDRDARRHRHVEHACSRRSRTRYKLSLPSLKKAVERLGRHDLRPRSRSRRPSALAREGRAAREQRRPVADREPPDASSRTCCRRRSSPCSSSSARSPARSTRAPSPPRPPCARSSPRRARELTVSNPDLSVLTAAARRTSPSSPHPTRNAAIGLLVGLVLGIMLGVLRDRLDRRTRGIDEVEAVYRAPMLGMVPVHEAAGAERRAPRGLLGLGPAGRRVPDDPNEPLAVPAEQLRQHGRRHHLGGRRAKARAPSRRTSRTR